MRSLELPLSETLRTIPPAVRPTVQAARRMVKSLSPAAKEVPYRSRRPKSNRTMWKLVRFGLDDGYVVGIGVYEEYASLFFYRGRELDDGSGLLEGGGKDLRSIKLRAPADAESAALKRLVRRAFQLGGAPST